MKKKKEGGDNNSTKANETDTESKTPAGNLTALFLTVDLPKILPSDYPQSPNLLKPVSIWYVT